MIDIHVHVYTVYSLLQICYRQKTLSDKLNRHTITLSHAHNCIHVQYTYICTHRTITTHTCTCTCTIVHVYIQLYTCTVNIHMYTQNYNHTHIYMYNCTCIYMYTCTHRNTPKHTHTHTHGMLPLTSKLATPPWTAASKVPFSFIVSGLVFCLSALTRFMIICN